MTTEKLKIYGKEHDPVARIIVKDLEGNDIVFPGLIDIILLNEPSGEITIPSSIIALPNQYSIRNRPITRVHAPELRAIPQYSFSNTSITRIEPEDFPKAYSVSGAFESISTLTYVKLDYPFTGNGLAYAFRGCSNLIEAYFPNANNANIDRTCQNCTKLEIMDCGSGNITTGSSFQNCTNLRTLILRKPDGIQTLNAWTANCLGGIYNNPTESTIYIPKAMYDHLGDTTELDYYAATNWSSAYAAGVTFAKIEGSQYELE